MHFVPETISASWAILWWNCVFCERHLVVGMDTMTRGVNQGNGDKNEELLLFDRAG